MSFKQAFEESLIREASYFATCPRDDKGRCEPSGDPGDSRVRGNKQGDPGDDVTRTEKRHSLTDKQIDVLSKQAKGTYYNTSKDEPVRMSQLAIRSNFKLKSSDDKGGNTYMHKTIRAAPDLFIHRSGVWRQGPRHWSR